MTEAESAPREMKISAVSPLSFLRVLEAIRRKITAAKDRSFDGKRPRELVQYNTGVEAG